MKSCLFFLFLLSFELVSAGFGVSPVEIVDRGEFYVINSDNYWHEYLLEESGGVSVDNTYLMIAPGEKKKVRVNADQDGLVEVIEKGDGLASGLVVRVKSTKPVVEFYSGTNGERTGFLGIVLINVLGLIVGGFVWKKKPF